MAWAHNPEVRGLKPRLAKQFLFLFIFFTLVIFYFYFTKLLLVAQGTSCKLAGDFSFSVCVCNITACKFMHANFSFTGLIG